MRESRQVVMVIAAHPDDAEFGAAGTVARWAREGREIIYVVCTNGDKGSSDLGMTPERLAAIREQEQRQAARLLGVKDIVFLGHPDGSLEDTPAFRGELVRLLRKYRPDTVLTSDPYRHYLWHRDHRVAGMVALDAVYPYARDHLFYPEHLAEGLLPHKVKEVYLWGSEEPNTFIDITETLAVKIEALRCHASQTSRHQGGSIEQWVREWAAKMGEKLGVPFAEGFRRLEIEF
jgi:LmbE family N-acetylglucosaminyl deacetylase